MVYIVGFFGFLLGFFLGQMLLFFMLRHVPNEKLLSDPFIKWKFGLLNWAVAGGTCYFLVAMYNRYFLL